MNAFVHVAREGDLGLTELCKQLGASSNDKHTNHLINEAIDVIDYDKHTNNLINDAMAAVCYVKFE